MDLQAETTNATSESALKVALDYGKAHGVIKSHDRVVICQKVGDSAVVKIMELEDWTGGAFLFDNILLLRSWAFEGFSNYQVSRSWAKIKKNKSMHRYNNVYCYDSTSFKTSKPCCIIFSVCCRRVYQYLCNVITYPWRKNEKNNIIGGTGSCSIYRYVTLNSIENLDAFTYGKC